MSAEFLNRRVCVSSVRSDPLQKKQILFWTVHVEIRTSHCHRSHYVMVFTVCVFVWVHVSLSPCVFEGVCAAHFYMCRRSQRLLVT